MSEIIKTALFGLFFGTFGTTIGGVIGAFFGAIVGNISQSLISICLAFAAGAMLYIVSRRINS